jgi:hypothetical protein
VYKEDPPVCTAPPERARGVPGCEEAGEAFGEIPLRNCEELRDRHLRRPRPPLPSDYRAEYTAGSVGEEVRRPRQSRYDGAVGAADGPWTLE